MIQGRFTFERAFEECSRRGGKLAVIRNAEDQKLAAKATAAADHPGCRRRFNYDPGCLAYIGYKRILKGSKEFVWISGKAKFVDFHPREPNNIGGNEDCTQVNWHREDAKWNDIRCDYKMSALCEFFIASIPASGFCSAEEVWTKVGNLPWPVTRVGDTHRLKCPDGDGFVSRYCGSMDKWEDSNMTECLISKSVSDSTEKMRRLIAKGEVVLAVEVFKYATKHLPQSLTSEDLDNVLSTLSLLSRRAWWYDMYMAKTLTDAISNLLSVAVENMPSKSGLKFIHSIEKIQSYCPETNVANNVINSMMASFSCLQIRQSSGDFFQFSSDGFLRRAFESTVADMNASFTIAVPKSAAPNATHVHFSFLNSSLYFAAAMRLRAGQRLSQQLLSASFGSGHVKDLNDPVVIKFLLPRSEDGEEFKPSCVFWDSERNQMSDIGCNASSTKDANGTAVICTCNHLASFALLMDVVDVSRNISSIFSTAFRAFSYLGASLSVGGLLLTLITYLHFKRLRNNMPEKILILFCFTLLFVILVFLAEPLFRNDIACKVVGILLHYSYLSVMLWSSVVAVHVYLTIVKVFDADSSRFLPIAGLFAWGVPAVVVGITIIISSDNYCLKSGALCFLRDGALIWAFTVPITTLMIANVVVFVLVIVKMRRSKGNHNEASRQSNREIASEAQIIGSIGLCVIFGVTWVIGFFAVKKEVARGIFQTLFIVFHTTQGLFIFLVYCLFKTDVSMAWGKYFHCFYRMARRLDQHSSWNIHYSRAPEEQDIIGEATAADRGTAQSVSTEDASTTNRDPDAMVNEAEIDLFSL